MRELNRRPGAREAFRRSAAAAGAAGATAVAEPPPPTGAGAGPEREFTVEARSLRRMIVRRFFRHRLAMVALVVLLAVVLLAFVGARLWKYEFSELTGDNSQSPSWEHPFGTDTIGQDMFARVLRGAQISVTIALIVAIISTFLGVLVGSLAGYYRGWVDTVLMRLCDLMLVVPTIAIAAALGRNVEGGNWWMLAVLLGLIGWPVMARLVRGEFLSLREKEFVEAARAVGASDARIIFRHILPNLAGSIIVNATLTIASAILLETALSYLGLGVKNPDASLGLLVSDNQSAFATRPWLFWFPGAFILLITLSVNFIGDGLRDAFDPKQTRVRA
jgi:ABC-type dipeptide/oligopeptide/nickel transport system permease subunit